MNYPAKILLFGEYGIILDSMALAIPYPLYSGQFRFYEGANETLDKKVILSNEILSGLLGYFKDNSSKFQGIHLERFQDEIRRGLYFDSSIPEGSGLGSSGSLTAAVYERYSIGFQKDKYQLIKEELASIESYFHGLSSGVDPFVSLIKKPVLQENQNTLNTSIDLSYFLSRYTLFLIDSNSKSKTADLVALFMEQYRHPDFMDIIDNQYIPIINQTIKSVIDADFETFETLMAIYSTIQRKYFEPMIPIQMRKYFDYGFSTAGFYLKLCGSGGGGFLLGIARDRFKAEAYFNLNHLDYTVVN
jgi:mevalonate kinase